MLVRRIVLLLAIAGCHRASAQAAAEPEPVTCYVAAGSAFYFGANRPPLDSTATLVLLGYRPTSNATTGAATLPVFPYSTTPETASWSRLGDSVIVTVVTRFRQWEFRLRPDPEQGAVSGTAILTTSEMVPGPDNQATPVRFRWPVRAAETPCDAARTGGGND